MEAYDYPRLITTPIQTIPSGSFFFVSRSRSRCSPYIALSGVPNNALVDVRHGILQVPSVLNPASTNDAAKKRIASAMNSSADAQSK
jgi:hypothetical protein